MARFTAADGTALHYTDDGEGTPVLCLSGLTRNSTDFDYLAPHLPDVRLIRLDYRGRGKSDWADPSSYAVPVEARDALALLDHLGIARAAIIGTSRGGLIAMLLAAMAADRLLGICLNDIGPELAPAGLSAIMDYVGRNPAQKTHAEALEARANLMAGFANVPESRWAEEVRKHYIQTPDGLTINYDPALGDVMRASADQPVGDMWPLFDAAKDLPLAVIRGANSDLLTRNTVAEMQRRRPDMIQAEVPDRGHIPFLDEPEALGAIRKWIGLL